MSNVEYNIERSKLLKIDKVNKIIRSVSPYQNKYIIGNENIDIVITRNFDRDEDDSNNNYLLSSRFKNIVRNFIPDLYNTIIDQNELNDAIKDKCTIVSIDVQNSNIYLREGTSKLMYLIGKKLNQSQFQAYYYENNIKFENYKKYITQNNIDTFTRTASESEINKLINYKSVSFELDHDLDASLIATCKLFPNVKKIKSLEFTWSLYLNTEQCFVFIKVIMNDYDIEFNNIIKSIKC